MNQFGPAVLTWYLPSCCCCCCCRQPEPVKFWDNCFFTVHGLCDADLDWRSQITRWSCKILGDHSWHNESFKWKFRANRCCNTGQECLVLLWILAKVLFQDNTRGKRQDVIKTQMFCIWLCWNRYRLRWLPGGSINSRSPETPKSPASLRQLYFCCWGLANQLDPRNCLQWP